MSISAAASSMHIRCPLATCAFKTLRKYHTERWRPRNADAFNSQEKFIVGFFKCQYHSASSVTQNLILAPVQFFFR